MAELIEQKRKMPEKVNDLMSISKTSNVILNIFFFLLAACFVIPVILVIVVSFTPERTITLQGYSFFPPQMSDYVTRSSLTLEGAGSGITAIGANAAYADGVITVTQSEAENQVSLGLGSIPWESRSAYFPYNDGDNMNISLQIQSKATHDESFTLYLSGGAEDRKLADLRVRANAAGSIKAAISLHDIMKTSPLGDAEYAGTDVKEDAFRQALGELSLKLVANSAAADGEYLITAFDVSMDRERWLTLYNYEYLFKQPEIVFRAYGTTIFVTVVGTLMSVLVISLYAYPLSRHDYPYRKFFTIFMFITMVFNGGLVPYYITVTNVLSINDTIWCLLLPLLFNSFWCIVMRTFYQQSVPEALVESARLDGASEIRSFFQIVLPISLPGLATIALFMFVTYWNDYYQAMLFLNAKQDELQTMQFLCYRALSQAQFLRQQAAALGMLSADQLRSIPDEGYRMTIAVVTMGPILIVYPFFQRYFIQGLTVGAVKG